MIQCTCLVQAGQVPASREAQLRAGLQDFSQRAFGTGAEINWITVPQNSGFTAAKPSTSSVVSMRANVPLEQPRRVELLNELCALWMRETECSLDEVVAVLGDPRTH